MTYTPKRLRVTDRITAYLAGGGFFNPECANHDAVRNLLIDARDELRMLRLHIADKNAAISAMGAARVKLDAAHAAKIEGCERLREALEHIKKTGNWWESDLASAALKEPK